MAASWAIVIYCHILCSGMNLELKNYIVRKLKKAQVGKELFCCMESMALSIKL